ncbi:uncharacterized protein LOC102804087 [Saccoglossus kowalevskii]|uniref:H2.0-like homeobox protein-like n=1 Tax=Saccoglossus kowalevskii TaxID=10224 RepID=A0ABM0M8A5_SACKO|nr:PREDICTED: H2.0-like homeobox protein-like [Saccoglossus kowalevskii]
MPRDIQIQVKQVRSHGVADILQNQEQDRLAVDDHRLAAATHYDQPTLSISSVKSIHLGFGIDKILSDDVKPKNSGHNIRQDIDVAENESENDHSRTICQPNIMYPSTASQPSVMYTTNHLVYSHNIESSSHYHHLYGQDCHNPYSYQGPYTVLTPHDGWRPMHHQQHKRKRSWSRAVFTNLQRKGLEKRFEIQKYVTKPDRRQLAASLGLTDAQVKVWFQNRRMKWRHTKEMQTKNKNEKHDHHDDEYDDDDTNLKEQDNPKTRKYHDNTPSNRKSRGTE